MAKAALVELGVIDSAAVRLPLVESPPRAPRAAARRPRRRCPDPMSHPHPELTTPPPLADGGVRVVAAGRPRRGRPQHDRLRARGQLLDHRLRRPLPRGPPARRRPDPARLRVHQGPARRRRGRRPHARPRGPHRRRALPAAPQARHPADRLHADPRARRGQAQGAPDHAVHARRARGRSASSSASSTASSSRSTTRSPTRSPWPSAPRPARCCTPATSRWTSCRSTAGSPTCAPSPGWARRASTSSSPTPPTPRCPGFTTPERDIAPAIDKVFRQRRAADHRRLLLLARAPRAAGARRRRARTAARSPWSAARWCATWASPPSSATCTCPTGVLVDVKKLDDLADDQIVLISTGRQGEPMAALSRMANRDHRIEVGPGDTVLLASSLIPGNENAVYRVINGLMRLGANVVHKGNAKVHVSGHASAGELLYCYNIVKPRNVMPVHGEWRHLVANARPRHRHRRARATASSWPRTASSSTSSTAGPRSPAPCRAATSTSTAPRSARPPSAAQGPPDPGRRGLHLGHRRRRRGHRQGRSPARRSTRAVSPRTTRSSTRSAADRARRSPRPPPGGSPTPTSSSRSSAASVGGWVGRKLRRRPMIIPIVIEA